MIALLPSEDSDPQVGKGSSRSDRPPERRPRCGRLLSYRDAVHWLESLVRTPPRTRIERERLGLAPIESLLERIGNPHHEVPVVHVTGSKGKGSTALYTEALLTAAGFRTGTFTSPHLEEWTERIRIAGAPAGKAGFVEALERIRPAVMELQAIDAEVAPAFFDALVAAAFSRFADPSAPVEIVVVEAGIGARLDPTRVCQAVATCVTGVELEHADKLGPTLGDVAREKAAIARPGVPLVAGSMPGAARAVLEREAARAGAPVLWLGRDVTIRNSRADGCPVGVTLAERTIPVSLRQPGRHMLENAALALALANEAGALERLDDAAAGAALEAAVLPGRAEVLREAPLVIADGAHTHASIEALVGILDAQVTADLVAVVSLTRGKDAARVLSPLVQRADIVIATAADASRSLPAAELARTLETLSLRAMIARADTPAEAIRAAIDAAGREGTVCATGSMYMAGAARRFTPRPALLPRAFPRLRSLA